MHSYRFRPLRRSDEPFVVRWRQQPAVRQWWGDPAGESEVDNLDDPRIAPWIVELDGRPFAYAQDYDVHGWENTGPTEYAGFLMVSFLVAPNLQPDVISPRVDALPDSLGVNDKAIFGTADIEKVPIITGDTRFVRAAAAHGVELNHEAFSPPARYNNR